MPTPGQLALLTRLPGLAHSASRLRRRYFEPLVHAPKVQGRAGEWWRMFRRIVGGPWADERLAYEANDWLMGVMQRECRRKAVTVVHSYEDCSLLQFTEAARIGKVRVYDLPIGYYPAWESMHKRLAQKYADWIPGGSSGTKFYVKPQQKRREMELASVVLAPSSFVAKTVHRFADREVIIAPYGVDSEFWSPGPDSLRPGPMRFLYAGQCSVRKGTPLLIEAWRAASIQDAVLELVGQWRLASDRRTALPANVIVYDPLSSHELRARYRQADAFVFPSNFEGFSLAILEALACGLPAIVTDATSGSDFIDDAMGRVIPADDLDALVNALRWMGAHRDRIDVMRRAARAKAEAMTWARYRSAVRAGVAKTFARGPSTAGRAGN